MGYDPQVAKRYHQQRETDMQIAAREADQRPTKGSWAPGNYLCRCYGCDRVFFGDKRAVECAPCAYGDNK